MKIENLVFGFIICFRKKKKERERGARIIETGVRTVSGVNVDGSL